MFSVDLTTCRSASVRLNFNFSDPAVTIVMSEKFACIRLAIPRSELFASFDFLLLILWCGARAPVVAVQGCIRIPLICVALIRLATANSFRRCSRAGVRSAIVSG